MCMDGIPEHCANDVCGTYYEESVQHRMDEEQEQDPPDGEGNMPDITLSRLHNQPS